MLSDQDLELLQKVARRKARQLSRHRQDQEDLEQDALLGALQKPEYSTRAARFAAGMSARRQRRAAKVRLLEGIGELSDEPGAERHWSLHQERGRGGQFVPRGQGVACRLDVETIKALPTMRQVVDDLVRRAFAACDGRIALAAAALGMGPRAFRRRLRALDRAGSPAGTPAARTPAAARSSTE